MNSQDILYYAQQNMFYIVGEKSRTNFLITFHDFFFLFLFRCLCWKVWPIFAILQRTPLSTEEWNQFYPFYFAGCSNCVYRCQWAHYPVKSGAGTRTENRIKIHCELKASEFCCVLMEYNMLCLYFWTLQFSVTEHYRGTEIGNLQFLPGVFFFYDLSPIKVRFAAYPIQ